MMAKRAKASASACSPETVSTGATVIRSITEAALRNRNSSFVIDGEAVLLGVDGISDFDGLHSRKHNDEVQFYAFDILVSDGDDLRKLPLSLRKTNLARLLARRSTEFSCRTSSRARLGPTCFVTPA